MKHFSFGFVKGVVYSGGSRILKRGVPVSPGTQLHTSIDNIAYMYAILSMILVMIIRSWCAQIWLYL